MLINNTLCDALCEQVTHELYNANLYLFICAFFRNKGLDNLAKHFEKQNDEEISHAKEIVKLLTDLSAPVHLSQVDEVNLNFNTVLEIATVYLDREVLTTNSLSEIKKLAIQNDNPVVEERMRQMIIKQQDEYSEATTFYDNSILCKDWWQVKVWNDSLGG